jgi:hypothetical protein
MHAPEFEGDVVIAIVSDSMAYRRSSISAKHMSTRPSKAKRKG